MVGGMLRHLHSLRTMRRDHDWIRTLLAEAENERMHLLTFMELRQPGWLFRATVLGAKGVMTNVLFLAYLVSPPTVHRMVGYLEEEAVRTYTHLLHDIDSGNLEEWRTAPAPQIAKDYWKLGEASTMRDVIAAVRADEGEYLLLSVQARRGAGRADTPRSVSLARQPHPLGAAGRREEPVQPRRLLLGERHEPRVPEAPRGQGRLREYMRPRREGAED